MNVKGISIHDSVICRVSYSTVLLATCVERIERLTACIERIDELSVSKYIRSSGENETIRLGRRSIQVPQKLGMD